MTHPKIPNHNKGDFHDIVNMICLATTATAKNKYKAVIERLKNVNEWHTYGDSIKAKFALIDPSTHEITSDFNVGTLIRIKLPGPGNNTGQGFDWTKIVDIQTSESNDAIAFYLMTLKPCSPPNEEEEVIAHFYEEQSTNTFIIRHIGTCVYAEVHGRNETINISDVPLIDSIRNIGINIGNKMGLGKLNWLGFTKAILAPNK